MKKSFRLLVTLGAFLPMLEVFGAQPALAVAINGIASVGHALERRTTLPVLMPASVPESLTSAAVYAHIGNASRSAYLVDFTTTANCGKAASCFLGTIAGSANTRLVPAGRSSLVWKRGSAWYRLEIAGASAYSLKMMAASLRRY
jgi:hypothetical protein